MTDFRGVLIRHTGDLIILAEPAPRLNGWYEPRLYTYRGTGYDEPHRVDGRRAHHTDLPLTSPGEKPS